MEAKSKTTWAYLFVHKSQVPTLLASYLAYIQNHFKVSVKVLRSDNEAEFINSTLHNTLASLGIQHQTSCSYTPQQNDVVERKHNSLLNTARALRLQAGLPHSFWEDCILTSTYLLNRTPSSVLHGSTPYKILFHAKPDYTHLRTFGSMCYVTNQDPHKDKFSDKALKCLFLGYPVDQKAYRVMNFETKKVFTFRDVVFVEDTFPFHHISLPSPATLFPSDCPLISDESPTLLSSPNSNDPFFY